MKNNWVDIRERMPNVKEEVLVTDGREQYVAWFSDKCWTYSYCCGCLCDKVTHWMPLPELPEGLE